MADAETTVFIGMLGSYFVINGKSFPDTQPLMVKHGQTVHIRLIGAEVTMIHPMHLHGHYFTIVAEDGHLLPQPIQKDTVSLAPGETYDLTFYARSTTGSLSPLHCHILSHLMNPGQSGDEMGGLIVLMKYASWRQLRLSKGLGPHILILGVRSQAEPADTTRDMGEGDGV